MIYPDTIQSISEAPQGNKKMNTETTTNLDVILWALYDLGGDEKFVDIEDIFLKAFEIAPLRLSWRTHKELPDMKKCYKALNDTERQQPNLILKQGPERRRLTAEGQKWIEKNFDRLADALGGDRKVHAPRIRLPSRLVNQALRSDVFNLWKEDGSITNDKWRVAEMLRCLPDSAQKVFRERLESLRSAAYSSGHLEALDFFDAIVEQHPDWF